MCINEEKPYSAKKTPFQYIRDDPLIACVGNNGGTTDYSIFKGFADTVKIIYDSLKIYQTEEDAMVYPMAFSARHCVELGLKISIRELRDFLNFKKIASRINRLDVGQLDKMLLEHDLQSLANSMFAFMKIDRRFLAYKSLMEPYLCDYYFDKKGDMFRYAESRDKTSNLVEANIEYIGLTTLYERFSMIVKYFDEFYETISMLYDEYKTGSYTQSLTRGDIEKIADELPNIADWKEDRFKCVKNQLKEKYQIGSNELSQAIDIIKDVPVFSVKIGKEIKKGFLTERELITYRRAVKEYKKEKKKQPQVVVLGDISNKCMADLFSHENIVKKMCNDISFDAVKSLYVFFIISHSHLYVEDFDKVYEYVDTKIADCLHLARKLIVYENYLHVINGMELCGQNSYNKVLLG